jgi:glycosyltransferase involved in cell wall biosynthesis
MNIGIICGEYPPCNNGGIGTYTKELAEGLVNKGNYVVVFGFYYPYYLKVENTIVEKINGVEVVRMPFKKYSRITLFNEIANRFSFWLFTRKIISEKKLDVVEVYDSTGVLPFPVQVPKITRLHGSVTFFGKELNRPFSRSSYWFEYLQLITSNEIVGVSRYVLDKTKIYFNLKIGGRVIHNSVQVPTTNGPEKIETTGVQYLLFFGSLLPKKGIEQLVESMNIVFKKFPNVKLYIVGKSDKIKSGVSYTDYLLNLVEPNFRDGLVFFGHRNKEDLLPLIQKSYCCVLPSHSECFSLAPMEAMTLGVPVIYSRLHSGPELIDSGIDGLLVDPSNISDIAAKIISLLEDPEFSRDLGKRGQLKINDDFNFVDWVNTNENFFMKYNKRKQ